MIKAENELVVSVGGGWYRSQLSWDVNNINFYGDKCGIIAKIEIKYDDSEEVIYTDESWLCGNGPILSNGIYAGEVYDARISAVFDKNAEIFESDKDNLFLQDREIVCEHERLKPISFITTPKGEKVIDFGQNMTGYVEIKVTAKAGDRVVISHAEVLDRDGNFTRQT